ncbi:hypothetical protein GYH30_000998 [Glycine max]|nr:hypothetical protein GYH30_000998 [Glycine max]
MAMTGLFPCPPRGFPFLGKKFNPLVVMSLGTLSSSDMELLPNANAKHGASSFFDVMARAWALGQFGWPERGNFDELNHKVETLDGQVKVFENEKVDKELKLKEVEDQRQSDRDEIKKLRKSLEVASHMVDDEKLAKLKLEATIKQEVFE